MTHTTRSLSRLPLNDTAALGARASKATGGPGNNNSSSGVNESGDSGLSATVERLKRVKLGRYSVLIADCSRGGGCACITSTYLPTCFSLALLSRFNMHLRALLVLKHPHELYMCTLSGSARAAGRLGRRKRRSEPVECGQREVGGTY